MLLLRNVITMSTLLTLVVMLFSLSGVSSTVEEDEAQCQPQHVHLSLGEAEDQMAVLWATNGTCDTTHVLYGTTQWLTAQNDAAAHSTSASGRQVTYTEHNANGVHVLHKAVLKGLEGSKTYFYRPTSHNIGAGPFYFQAPPHGTDWSPELLVVGDLGPHLELLPVLTEEALTGQYTAVLQLGGLSPFLSDANGTKGDILMKGLEHMAAFVPVMTAPGQSETPAGQFPGYRHRFSMPGSSWPMLDDQLWYSFNLGLAHFVSLSTDIYLRGNQTAQALQKKWLVKDLSQANTEREQRPWIIAFGHHPLYCPGEEDKSADCAKADSLVRKGLEETLYYYGVDLVLLSGPAQSSYRRFYPLFKGVSASANYTNPKAPVHIVSGAAGDTVNTSSIATATTTTTTTTTAAAHVHTPRPVVGSPESVTATGKTPKSELSDGGSNSSSSSSSESSKSSSDAGSDGSSGSSTRSSEGLPIMRSKRSAGENGNDANQPSLMAMSFVNATHPTYGRLRIVNASHLHWELVEGGSGGKVLDSMTLVQEHHGKFKLSQLPDDAKEQIDENMVASGGKPGVLNVHDPVLENKMMLAADSSRRLIIGVSFGAVVVIIVIVAVAVKVKSRTKRRSVRRWDVMDYKYGKTKLYTPTNDEDDEDDDFQDDHDFEMDVPDVQTKKLINGK